MTDRDQQEATYPIASENPGKESVPAPLWLAVIPMVVISLIGMTAGFPLLSNARADRAERPPGPDESTAAVAPEPPPARPEGMFADRPVPSPPIVPPTVTAEARAVKPSPTSTAVSAASRSTNEATTGSQPASGCEAAFQWLSAHAAPGFRFECPGDALGHQAMTCVNVANVCPGQRIITIADACAAAYMNEAHNSWILVGLASGRLDPYGSCG